MPGPKLGGGSVFRQDLIRINDNLIMMMKCTKYAEMCMCMYKYTSLGAVFTDSSVKTQQNEDLVKALY